MRYGRYKKHNSPYPARRPPGLARLQALASVGSRPRVGCRIGCLELPDQAGWMQPLHNAR